MCRQDFILEDSSNTPTLWHQSAGGMKATTRILLLSHNSFSSESKGLLAAGRHAAQSMRQSRPGAPPGRASQSAASTVLRCVLRWPPPRARCRGAAWRKEQAQASLKPHRRGDLNSWDHITSGEQWHPARCRSLAHPLSSKGAMAHQSLLNQGSPSQGHGTGHNAEPTCTGTSRRGWRG